MKDLDDMVETLANSSILSKVVKQKKKYVKLEVELAELTLALKPEREEVEEEECEDDDDK